MRTAALALLLIAPALCAAPAPLPKREKPPCHVSAGDYLLRWDETDWHVAFLPDGSYRGRVDDRVWLGTWSYDQQTRTLSVSEGPGDGYLFSWSVALDGSLAGRCSWGTTRITLSRRGTRGPTCGKKTCDCGCKDGEPCRCAR